MIREYLLIIRLHVKNLYTKQPIKWKIGKKGNVILLPGYAESFLFLWTIGNLLNNLGYRIWVLEDFKSTGRIDDETKKFVPFIKNNNLTNIILVGHSRGGLIAKLLVDKYPKIAGLVKKIITIATPWQGTAYGYIRFWNLVELKPDSNLIKKLSTNSANTAKIVNLYPRIDNHVLPNRNLVLTGADNRQIHIMGHTRILECKDTLECISLVMNEIR